MKIVHPLHIFSISPCPLCKTTNGLVSTSIPSDKGDMLLNYVSCTDCGFEGNGGKPLFWSRMENPTPILDIVEDWNDYVLRNHSRPLPRSESILKHDPLGLTQLPFLLLFGQIYEGFVRQFII